MNEEKVMSTSDSNAIKLASMDEKILSLKESVTEMKTGFRDDLTEIKNGIKDLIKQVDDSYAPRTEMTDLTRRVNGMEDWQRWAARIVIGAVLVAILAALGLNYR